MYKKIKRYKLPKGEKKKRYEQHIQSHRDKLTNNYDQHASLQYWKTKTTTELPKKPKKKWP